MDVGDDSILDSLLKCELALFTMVRQVSALCLQCRPLVNIVHPGSCEMLLELTGSGSGRREGCMGRAEPTVGGLGDKLANTSPSVNFVSARFLVTFANVSVSVNKEELVKF